MADNIVGGLFGIDPSALQQQRMTQDLKEGYMLAQLDPMQRATAGIYAGAKQFGRAAQGLLGIEDPQLAAAKEAQGIMGQFDPSTSEGLKGLTSALLQRAKETNNPVLGQLAQQAGQQYQKALVNEATVYQKTKEAQPKTEEIVNRRLFEGFLRQAGGDEVLAAQLYQKAEDDKKLQRAGASANKITVAGQKNILEIDKKDAENLTKIRDTAENVLPRLQEQSAALQKGIAAGTFSDARVAFSTALSSLGIKDKATLDMLKNTKTFNANRIELAASVAKQLGVNPTDRDFKASLDRFASASDAPEASAAFINDMTLIQQARLKQANEGLNYYRKNDGSFAGYDRPLPVSPVVANDPFAGKSLTELYQMRDAAKKKPK